jgi:hypothetical protein
LTIFLSQLLSSATLLASAVPLSETSVPPGVITVRGADVVRSRNALAALLSSDDFVRSIFGLRPMSEERPYAL